MTALPPLVLASASPRRHQLLSLLGLPFSRETSGDEGMPLPTDKFQAWVEIAARIKASVVAREMKTGLVLAADTVVVYEGRALGKPASPPLAQSWLMELRGKRHQVMTGVAVVDVASGNVASNHTVTDVWMRNYSLDEVQRYVLSGDPLDKAGAYAIQSKEFHPVERIQGCYYNVMGLPLLALAQALNRLGFEIGPQARAAIPPDCRGCPTASALAQTASPELQ